MAESKWSRGSTAENGGELCILLTEEQWNSSCYIPHRPNWEKARVNPVIVRLRSEPIVHRQDIG